MSDSIAARWGFLPQGSRVPACRDPRVLPVVCASQRPQGGRRRVNFTNVGYEGEHPNVTCNATEGNTTYAQTGVSGGTEYTIPTDGAIVNWFLGAGTTPLPNPKLKVIRLGPASSQFTVIGEAAAGAPTANTSSTFATLIPVKAGDVLGFYPGSAGECLREGNESNEGLVRPSATRR